jgi:PAS domain S-box-containing protein
MTKLDPHSRDERILILAPVGRDATMTARYLSGISLATQVCADTQALCREMALGCGLLLLTDEALTPPAMRDLGSALPQQPPWSDIPLIILIRGGGETPINAPLLNALGEVGNVTLIERPVRQTTLLSTIQSALRARRRQYEVRDHLREEVLAREALSQSEERLRIALDAAQLGTWQLDLATGELDCTPTCKAFFGVPSDAPFSYKALLETIHPEDRAGMQEAVESAVRAGDVYRREYRIVLSGGSVRWILASGRANYDSGGKPYRMVGVTLDITERKNVEEERERLFAQEQIARAKAEEASRIKDEFLATVSHELRTPLNAILGWTHLLRTGEMDESTNQRALETIERNARSQAQLIEDLLDISRIITGKMRLEFQEVELAQVIEAALDGVRPGRQVQEHSVTAST